MVSSRLLYAANCYPVTRPENNGQPPQAVHSYLFIKFVNLVLIFECQGEQGEGIPGPPGPPGPPGGITVCNFFSMGHIKELFYNLVNILLFDSKDSVLCMLFFL